VQFPFLFNHFCKFVNPNGNLDK